MDHYVYPGTHTLANKFDIKDAEKLSIVEGRIFALKSLEPLPTGQFDYDHLKAIHHHFFGEIYDWAGQERTINMTKAGSLFAKTDFINKEINKIFTKLKTDNYLKELAQPSFCHKLSYCFNEINAIHPFREGNGRTLRALSDLLAEQAGYKLDWRFLDPQEYLYASISGFNGDYDGIEKIFNEIISPLNQDLSLQIAHTLNTSENIKIKLETLQEGNQHNYHFYVEDAIQTQARSWARTQVSDEHYSQVLIAQKQEDVNKLNDAAYDAVRKRKNIKNPHWSISTSYGWRDIAENIQIRFDKDFPEKEVKKNSLGVIIGIKRDTISAKLEDGREVSFTLKEYDALDYGYALTFEQAQEKPIEFHHVLITKEMDMKTLSFLTEKSSGIKCYWANSEFSDFNSLKKHLELTCEKQNSPSASTIDIKYNMESDVSYGLNFDSKP